MGLSVRFKRWALFAPTLGFAFSGGTGRAEGADRPVPVPAVWTGSGSCAATACHGGRREPLDLKGSEYTFSEAYDPHVRAYAVLFDERSLRIEKNYRRLANLELAKPSEDDSCLRCHVYQGFDSKATRSRTLEFTVADGAGCESCHGPAGKWLVPHVEVGWKGLNERQKLDLFGMRPTKDLLARGANCTECHVGLGATDVNHDLIAAGHPRLNFEYGSQLAKLPKHWRVAEDKARHPDYEAKVWALGQLLSAGASLDLLASRATRSISEDSNAPWPEFAEYSCFSCHHTLVKDGWPSANASTAGKLGGSRWGTWYSPMTKVLVPVSPGLDLDRGDSAFGLLRAEMNRPQPDPALVARRARAAAGELGRVAEALNHDQIVPGKIRSMLDLALASDDPGRPLDWDAAARQYLAIVAFDKASGETNSSGSNRPSPARLLRLLANLDLPRTVEGRSGLFDSPARWDLEQVRADFRRLLEPTAQP